MEIKTSVQIKQDAYNRSAKSNNQESTSKNVSSDQTNATLQGDRVSVSSEAKLYTEAYTAAQAAPEVRQNKVDAIKASIQEGTYVVDPKKIATKMLEEAISFGSTL